MNHTTGNRALRASLGEMLERVRESAPLVHSITNYVTANDCANALLACGASPIMSDDPADVADITAICGSLVLNIGTLNERSIEGMRVAGARAAALGHPIVLDPVGAGASALRTQTAIASLTALPITVVRGNMSEIRASAGAAATTRGADANPDDAVTERNLAARAAFARDLAERLDTVIAVTGAIDIVADARDARAIRPGAARMGRITGSGCMLSCLVGAYVAVEGARALDAATAAVAGLGLAGEIASARMGAADGTGSFRTYLIDAISRMGSGQLAAGARIEEL